MSEAVLAVAVQDKTRAGAIAAGRSFRDLTDAAGRTQKAVGGVTSSLGRMAGMLTTGVGLALFARQMAGATREAMEFRTAMAEVSTLLPDTSVMGELTASVREMSRAYGEARVDQAKALYQIISAGAADAAAAQQTLNAANKLAIGGVTNVATAADGLTTSLNAWGIAAERSTEVSDRFFVAMRAGKTTIGELSSSISFPASIAAQLGVSLDEVLAATAALTKGGVPTTRSMRGLAQVMATVAKPSSEAAKMAEVLGLEFNAAALKAKGLAGFLESVKVATGGDVEMMAQLFGGVEALAPVLSLTGKQADAFRQILDDMGTSAGQTEEALSKMMDDPARKLKQLQAQSDDLSLQAGETTLRLTEGIVEHFHRNLSGLNDLLADGYSLLDVLEAGTRDMIGAQSATSYLDMVRAERQAANGTLPFVGPQAPPDPSDPLNNPRMITMAAAEMERERRTIAAMHRDQYSAAQGKVREGAWADRGARARSNADAWSRAHSGPVQLDTSEDDAMEAAVVAADQRVFAARLSTMTELESLAAQHKQEMLAVQVSGDEDLIASTRAAQKAEMDAATASDESAKAAASQAEKTALVARVSSEAAGLLGRLAPELQGLGAAAASVVQGDYIGAAVNGMHGLMDVLGVARDPVTSLADSIAHLTRRIEMSASEMARAASELGGVAASDELVALQYAATRPLRELYDQVIAAKPNLSAMEQYQQFLTEAGNLLGGTARSGSRAALVGEANGGFWEIRRDIEAAFGEYEPDQLVRDLFSVEEAFEGIGAAAKIAADDMGIGERAIRLQFQGEEQALRQRYAGRFASAGSDVFEQQRVYSEMTAAIEALRHSQELALGQAAVSEAEYAPKSTTGGDISSGGSGGGLTGVDTYTATWPSTVSMTQDDSGRHVPDHWSWLVDIPSDLQKYERSWYSALEMREPWSDGYNYPHKPHHWSALVSIPSDLAKYERSWYQTVSMRDPSGDGYNHPHKMGHWSAAVDVSEATQIAYDWADTLSMGTGQANGDGGRKKLTDWALVFDVSRATRISVQVTDCLNLQWGRVHVDMARLLDIDTSGVKDALTAAMNEALSDSRIDLKSASASLVQTDTFSYAY